MNPIVYKEDQQKVKAIFVKVVVVALVVVVVGFIIFKSKPSRISSMRYMAAGLGGSLIGGGICTAVIGIKSLLRANNPSESIVSADEKGITIKTGETTNQSIAWQDIRSFSAAQKGIQSGVAVILKDPDKYVNALSPKEKAAAKQNKQFLGSPASIKTNFCAVSKEEIANELNKCLNSFQSS